MWWPPTREERFSASLERRYPTKSYRKEESKPEWSENCAVCLSRFQEGEVIRELGCSHVFHRDCIDEWLKQRRQSLDDDYHPVVIRPSCPLCRTSVFPEDKSVERRRLQRRQAIRAEEEIAFMSAALYGF